MVNTLSSFERIAEATGIALPALLRTLLATGRTDYGVDWQTTWRGRMLATPPPLQSCYDLQWLDAASSKEAITDWLNPEFQGGQQFLPFARNGAGDVFCLMPLDSSTTGVALVLHDDDHSVIGYRSFADFVCTHFLQTFADLSHLLDDFSEQEAVQIIRADVFHVTAFLDPEVGKHLQSLCLLPPKEHEYRDGPKARPRLALSFIDQAQLACEFQRFPAPVVTPFPVITRWEVPSYVSPATAGVPAPDWRSQALTPGKKFAALQAYQKEHNVGLAEAKRVVDEYIGAHSPDT